MRRGSNAGLLLLCLTLTGLLLLALSFEPSRHSYATEPSRTEVFIQSVFGVPPKIIFAAIQAGGIDAYFFGTPAERHEFAKGRPTRFGHMGFPVDDYLTANLGWSEEYVHQLGHQYGFSDLWRGHKTQ
jgi:hypothetical protein